MKKLFFARFTALLVAILFATSSFGANKAQCAQLQDILNKWRINNHVVGMGLYVDSPNAHCYLFSGVVKKGSKKTVTENNLWQIGSITKSFFSVILLQLEAESESGKIPVKFNINQKLKLWFPEYPDWGNITVKQLLNMTGGIYDYLNSKNVINMLLKNPKRVWSSDELVQLAYQHKPNLYFQPGNGWHYSNTDYIIAGMLIEKIYEKMGEKHPSLQDILKQRIIVPLKLTSTFYYPSGLPKPLLERMVHGYGSYNKKDWHNVNLSITGSAGAIVSTPSDVADWITALFSGKILPSKQLTEMQSLVSQKIGQSESISEAKTWGYALGLTQKYSKTNGPIWSYLGATFGYIATYYYIPKYNAIMSFTVNASIITKKDPPIASLAKKIMKVMFTTS